MNDYLNKWCCLIIFNSEENNSNAINLLASTMDCAKHIYYHKEIVEHDKLNEGSFKKQLLYGDNLGTEMQQAFKNAFAKGFRKVVLVKSDFEQLQTSQIIEAFNCLKMIEFCLGPKINGDYYLIGMNYFEPSVFLNKQWNSHALLKDTIKDIGKLKLALYKLSTLQTLQDAATHNT